MAKAKAKNTATYRDHVEALDAAARGMPRALAVVGEEPFLRLEALENLAAAFRAAHPAAEILTLRGPAAGGGGGDSLMDATLELGGTGLFAPEKLVVFRTADRALFPGAGGGSMDEAGGAGADESPSTASAPSAADPAERFLAALGRLAPGLWCWLDLAALPRNRRFGKALAGLVHIIPCPALKYPRDQEAWLRRRTGALGKRLEPEAAEMLLAMYGGRPGALAAELEKLSVHAGAEPAITAAAVRLFFSGTMELDVFGLTGAIENRDLDRALDLARRIGGQGLRDEKGKLEGGDGSARRVLHLLSTCLENLFAASALRAAGASPGDLAARAGLNPWLAEKQWNAAANYSPGQLRRALGHLAIAAREVNDTGGDPRLALETVVVRITGDGRG